MDRITQSMIDSFKSNQSLNIDDDSELFEYFVNYCVVNNVYGSNDFDLEEITNRESNTRNRWNCDYCKSKICKYY